MNTKLQCLNSQTFSSHLIGHHSKSVVRIVLDFDSQQFCFLHFSYENTSFQTGPQGCRTAAGARRQRRASQVRHWRRPRECMPVQQSASVRSSILWSPEQLWQRHVLAEDDAPCGTRSGSQRLWSSKSSDPIFRNRQRLNLERRLHNLLESFFCQKGVPNAESSRSMRGLRKGVSDKPYPHLCNAGRP